MSRPPPKQQQRQPPPPPPPPGPSMPKTTTTTTTTTTTSTASQAYVTTPNNQAITNKRRPTVGRAASREQRPVSEMDNEQEALSSNERRVPDKRTMGVKSKSIERSIAQQRQQKRTSPAVGTSKGTSDDSGQPQQAAASMQKSRPTDMSSVAAAAANTLPGQQPPPSTSTATSKQSPPTAVDSPQGSSPRLPEEAPYLNQSTRASSTGSMGGDSRYDSTRRLADDMDQIDDDDNVDGGELGATGAPPIGAGLTRNLTYAVLASTVGSSFQHGYNSGVINAPEKLIGEFINSTYKARHGEWATEGQVDLIFSIIVSIFCIGGCIGALLTAFVADRVGRKEGLLYNNLIVLLASPIMASARSMSSYELLIIGRLLIGVNVGLNAGLAPLYLNEIAPVRLRGALGTIYQLVITISMMLSNIFGLPNLLGDQDSWPILFALPIIPAAVMLAALPHCYESPKHLLLNQGKELQAQQALAWFRHTSDVQEEMEELRNERELNSRSISLGDMISETSLRRPLTIAIVIMLSQQFSGINAVLFFSTSIFRDAGLGEKAAIKATLYMNFLNVFMTFVSLSIVDRAGRRTLHMTGLMGMAATCLVLAICLGSPVQSSSPLSSAISVVAVYVYIAMFASGPGSIPWFLVAELFPSNARPLASSIAVAVNWLANFTVSLCFLPLSNILHGYTFVLFAILLVIFYLFTYYKVPETKGATAEEISALFKR